jgi:hypothetical protein
MGVAKGLERRLERLVDGLASRLFRGRMHPVELGSMLTREADMALVERPAGPTAPNVYHITMGGEPVEADVMVPVAEELSRFVEEAAADRGWRLEGRARVSITVTPQNRSREVAIETAFEPGDLEPWALLQPVDPKAAAIAVRPIRALVGRSADADVPIMSDAVSRVHALIWQEGGFAWVCDLGSSNGTHLNGTPVDDPVHIVAGDLLTFGDTRLTVVEP